MLRFLAPGCPSLSLCNVAAAGAVLSLPTSTSTSPSTSPPHHPTTTTTPPPHHPTAPPDAMRDSNLQVDLANTASSIPAELPPIAALFVITFDIKAGYTISWRKTAHGVSLDGVEFKSLPSGLHNLDEDLVYFVQAPYAGVSAFIKVPAAEAERNALMLSVGILVPLSYGRLGRSWRHAANLKNLAAKFAADTSDHRLLDEYYETHQIHETAQTESESPVESPSSLRYRPAGRYKPPFDRLDRLNHTRSRSISDTTALVPPGQALSPFHPALSLGEYVDMFGPLIFPLYRAALNRQRILLITGAPVELACNFVYDISILSNIPLSVADLLSTEPSRLRPLFSIGVHDIPFLEAEAARTPPHAPPDELGGAQGSWVACTTDGVLYVKSSLYDVVCALPPRHNRDARKRIWPVIESPAGTPVLATQRDLARYRALRRALRGYRGEKDGGARQGEEGEGEGEERHREEAVCERLSWREIAYTGFIWWASAGEKRRDTAERAADEDCEEDSAGEEDGDSTGAEADTVPLFSRKRGGCESGGGGLEVDVVAYFHRLTARLLGVMAEIVEEGDDEEDVFFSLEDVDRLGLDRYSSGDVRFVKAICRRYFGREASVEEGGWNCCAGVRWC